MGAVCQPVVGRKTRKSPREGCKTTEQPKGKPMPKVSLLEDFEASLEGLSQSKSTIKTSTKAALRVPETRRVVEILLQRQKMAEDPLPFFFLVDSILKMA